MIEVVHQPEKLPRCNRKPADRSARLEPVADIQKKVAFMEGKGRFSLMANRIQRPVLEAKAAFWYLTLETNSSASP
jgi:hypothetical protein